MALIFSLFLTGCATKENFSITSNNDKWWKMKESYRGKIVAVTPFEAVTPLEEYLEFKLRVEIDLDEPLAKPILNKKYGEKCHQYVKEHKGDIMKLEFQSYNLTGDKYQFDTSKVYLITSSQKYHLKPVDYETREPIGYSINDLDGKFYRKNNYIYGPRLHYYHLPIICKQLDGAYFEISGIYQNGVELPPIKFQVSVLTRYKSIHEIVFEPLHLL